MDKVTEMIASYAASLTYAGLRAEAVHAAKRSLLDSIGCAIGAFNAEPVQIAHRVASRVTSTQPARILGTGTRTSPEWAAFVNGTMIRYLDYSDDYLNKDGPHPSDNIAAVLAVADALHADGKRVLTAIALAYEVVCRMVDVAPFRPRGWDYTTETAMGSSMAAGNLLGLSAEQMGHALSLAIVPNISLGQTRTGELSMWKGPAGANAARNAVFAALLAAEGMSGPYEPILGQHGLQKQVTGPFELEPFGSRGRPFKIEQTFFKNWPVRYQTQLPVWTAFQMRKKVNPKDIVSIKVAINDQALSTSHGPEAWDPKTRETADHSLPYLVAVAFIDGEITPKTFTPERFRDPEVLELTRKVSTEGRSEFTQDWPWTFHCRMTVGTRSGEVIEMHTTNPKGHPGNPMTDAELEEKFLKLTADRLPEKKARTIMDQVWHLEDLADISTLLEATVV